MTHAEKAQNIAEQIKVCTQNGAPLIFTKKTVSHFVPGLEKTQQSRQIYIGDLTEILEIDRENQICIAEAGVTFFDLVKKLLPFGLMPFLVPELKTITIGGAVSGCSVESMSYRYGGFHDNCLEYELIDGSGEIITCSREQNADIFEIVHGSYGTIGILTKLKFKLCPAKAFVKMTYPKFGNFADFWHFLQARCDQKDYFFIDAIIFGKEEFAVCLGEMTDSAPRVSNYDYLKIYYKSVQKKSEDYLRTEDYFFRYDTDCHWLSRTIPPLEWKIVRLFFGKLFLGSTNLIKWANRLTGILRMKKRPDVVVDAFVPAEKFPEFYSWYEKNFNFFPLWIVPYRMPQRYPWINPIHLTAAADLFIDCAVYGKKNNDPQVDYSELIENKVFDLGGIKTLISRNHYSEDRFWQIYNRSAYETVKAKTDPKNIFGTIYQRMVKKIK